ncbi:hypothetical protein DTO271D3_5954 [Paecilomyces variotii]|nr:hypothetical protein DTO271D3_5954 [Paecilomyces variotii]
MPPKRQKRVSFRLGTPDETPVVVNKVPPQPIAATVSEDQLFRGWFDDDKGQPDELSPPPARPTAAVMSEPTTPQEHLPPEIRRDRFVSGNVIPPAREEVQASPASSDESEEGLIVRLAPRTTRAKTCARLFKIHLTRLQPLHSAQYMKSLINFAAKKGVAWRNMVKLATVDSMQGTCAYDKRLMRRCSCKYTRRIYSSSRQRSVVGMSLQKPKDSLWLERGVTCSSLSESQRLAHIIKNARKLVAQMRKKRLAKMWISKPSKVEYTLRKAKIEAMQSAGDKTTETTQNDAPIPPMEGFSEGHWRPFCLAIPPPQITKVACKTRKTHGLSTVAM